MKAYCLICRKEMEMFRPEEVKKGSRKMMKGVCSKNHKMSKFI